MSSTTYATALTYETQGSGMTNTFGTCESLSYVCYVTALLVSPRTIVHGRKYEAVDVAVDVAVHVAVWQYMWQYMWQCSSTCGSTCGSVAVHVAV